MFRHAKTASSGRRGIRIGSVALSLALFPVIVAIAAAVHAEGAVGGAGAFGRLAAGGWVPECPVRVLGPDNLYEEIDGEAELFLPYGFRDLAVGIVSRKGNPGALARLELFRHATSRDAFGVYGQHRFPGQEIVAVGPSEAIVSDASLDFFRGTVFVRIRQASRGATRNDLVDLGRAVSAVLEGTGAAPRETEALRIDGHVPGTIVFQRRAVLGYEELAPGYEAKYASGELSGTLVLVPPADAGSAPRFLERISRSLPGFTRLDGRLCRADLRSGTLWLAEEGGWFAGVAGTMPRSRAESLIGEVLRRARKGRE